MGDSSIISTGTDNNWEKSIELELLSPSLPPQKLINTQWFHADCLADYYNVPFFSPEHWEAIEQQIITANKDYGVNMLLTPIYTPPLDTEACRERTTTQMVSIFKEDNAYSFDF